jgi:hypothetical protein
MICVSDLQQLISSWQERMNKQAHPFEYKNALSECIYDLNQLINHSIEEELDYKEMLDSWKADNYLSSIEAHEAVA